MIEKQKVMNNVFVYCEIDKYTIEEVSCELLTKGRKLANELGVQLEAIAAGHGITEMPLPWVCFLWGRCTPRREKAILLKQPFYDLCFSVITF